MKMIGRHAREVAERIVETFKHPEKLPIALAPIFIRRKDDVPCRKWSWHNQLLVALSGSIDARPQAIPAARPKVGSRNRELHYSARCIS